MFLKNRLDVESFDFYRPTGEGILRLPLTSNTKHIKKTVLLMPLKSLALSGYSFPFSNVLRVREALKLQTMPYAAAGGMELFPTPTFKASRSSSGVVWYVASGELDFPYPPVKAENLVWPAPLPLVSRINGEGVTVWVDEENISSMLWRDEMPLLYRWKSRVRATVESELGWFADYCRAQEYELGETFVLDVTQSKALAALPQIVRETLALYPWVGTVNLSRSALFSAMGLERTVSFLSRVAIWILVFGIIFLSGNFLRFSQVSKNTEKVRDMTSALYKGTFEPERTGRVSDPVGLAREYIAELQGSSVSGRFLDDALEDLGKIFEENPSMDITIDTLRYNTDGLLCTGSAPDMSTVLSFRKSWESRAALAQLDNTQNVQGLGYRFDLRLKW